MKERVLAGELYIADDPDLAVDSDRAQSLTHRINSMDPTDHDGHRALLRELLGAFGEGSEIRPPVRCDYGYQTTFGARSFAYWGLILLDVATITIGDDVQIGPSVRLLTATHPLEPGPRRDKREAAEPIMIGNKRVAGWRRDRLPGRDDRRRHRGGRGVGGHEGPAVRRHRRGFTRAGAARVVSHGSALLELRQQLQRG